MNSDDELCLCFHVTRRKVENYIRIEKPKRVGQLSDCYGAGTGCGWCRPFLRRLFSEGQDQVEAGGASSLPSSADYEAARKKYIDSGKGEPPIST